jgi:hypothetical protein
MTARLKLGISLSINYESLDAMKIFVSVEKMLFVVLKLNLSQNQSVSQLLLVCEFELWIRLDFEWVNFLKLFTT